MMLGVPFNITEAYFTCSLPKTLFSTIQLLIISILLADNLCGFHYYVTLTTAYIFMSPFHHL